MTVTFCGHEDFYGDVKCWLRETVEALILRGADDFLLGGYGGLGRLRRLIGVGAETALPGDPFHAGFALSGPHRGHRKI